MEILKEVHPNINVSDIDRRHRVGKKVPGKKRQIIVKFVSYWDRNKAISNRKSLRHKYESVYINEDLTQHRSKLFKMTRDLKLKHKIESVWTNDGRVNIRELPAGNKDGVVRVITCEKDLDAYSCQL